LTRSVPTDQTLPSLLGGMRGAFRIPPPPPEEPVSPPKRHNGSSASKQASGLSSSPSKQASGLASSPSKQASGLISSPSKQSSCVAVKPVRSPSNPPGTWWRGLPPRSPCARPGTSLGGGQSHVPFCLHGRDLPSASRFEIRNPSFLTSAPTSPSNLQKAVVPFGKAALDASGLPKLPGASYPPTPMNRSVSLPSMLQSPPTSPISSHPGDMSFRLASTSGDLSKVVATSSTGDAPKVVKEAPGVPGVRRTYLYLKDAEVLNRIEENLAEAGVDLRGSYHRLNKR